MSLVSLDIKSMSRWLYWQSIHKWELENSSLIPENDSKVLGQLPGKTHHSKWNFCFDASVVEAPLAALLTLLECWKQEVFLYKTKQKRCIWRTIWSPLFVTNESKCENVFRSKKIVFYEITLTPIEKRAVTRNGGNWSRGLAWEKHDGITLKSIIICKCTYLQWGRG